MKTKYKCIILKDGVEAKTLAFPSHAEFTVFILEQLMPQHKWSIEIEETVEDVTPSPTQVFAPIFFTETKVRCDLVGRMLVLTVPNLQGKENKNTRDSLHTLGFGWKRSFQHWTLRYTQERATDEFRDSIIEVLEKIGRVTKPIPLSERTDLDTGTRRILEMAQEDQC